MVRLRCERHRSGTSLMDDATGRCVVGVWFDYDDLSTDIVRAVNNHERLVVIAQRALTQSARVHPDFADEIRAALAEVSA